MSNRTRGTRFETEFCEKLAEEGFWAHDMTQGKAGQPADVIAVKDNLGYIIDCKVCETERFDFSRVEPNQEAAMRLWQDRGNTECYFAIKYQDQIYMISYPVLDALEFMFHQSSVKVTMLKTFEEWVHEHTNRVTDHNRKTIRQREAVVQGRTKHRKPGLYQKGKNGFLDG